MTINMNNLEPHQQRVVIEKAELDQKLEKLTLFINSEMFKNISKLEKEQLVCQEEIMKDYSDLLEERISNFNN